MIDYTAFERALKDLECYHSVYLEQQRIANRPGLEELGQLGLVRSFKVCYAALLKVLRRHLAVDMGVFDLGDGAKSVFRAADRNGLLADGVERWLGYVDARNSACHEYGIERLGHVLELIPVFLADAMKLYERMISAREVRVVAPTTSNEHDKIDLTAAHYRLVMLLLKRYLPDTRVWAFGSRVTFKARRTSDLDLVVFADGSRQREVSDLREAFEESDLPFDVDVLVWDRIPDRFKPNIRQAYFVLQ